MKDGTVLLVDGDNVPPEILGPLLDHLEEDSHVAERRIFRNWRSSRNAQAWDEASMHHAFERVDRYRTSSGKNASDIALVVTAMDLLHAGYRSFCIASGDTDFAPLVERLRRADAHVVLVGHKADGGILTDVADEYVDFRALGKPQGRPRQGAKASAKPAKPGPSKAHRVPSKSESPPSKPSKPSKARSAPKPKSRGKPAAQPPTKAQAGLESLRAVLLDCYEVARTDGELDKDGWVAVDRLGQIARSVDPKFHMTKFGLGARTSLTKAIARLGNTFQVRSEGRGGNRQYRVRRKE